MVFPVLERMWRRRCAPAASRSYRDRYRCRYLSRTLTPALRPLEERCLLSITIAIDYSLDTSHFFDSEPARHLMQLAADVVAQGLVDDHLGAITPSGGDTWSASFPDPATGANRALANLSIPADTIVVYVGGRPFATIGESGSGSTGGYSASGDPAWLDAVAGRGHAGALGSSPGGFGPWGGSIAFDTASTRWFLGDSSAGLTPDQTDFFTVAEHELGHILGIGTSASWLGHVSGNVFTGPASMAVYGGPVPLDPTHSHWADGVQSDGVNAVMDPVLYGGSRSMFTDLDDAALADVGWLVRPPDRASTVEFAAASSGVPDHVGTVIIGVRRTGGLDSFTVNYATGDGTARAGVDYQATSGTLTFGIGETSKSISIPILHDPTTGDTRTLTLFLGNPSPGAVLGPQDALVVSIFNGGQQPADDFDGDGRSDIAVFRPSSAQWFIQPSSQGAWGPITFGASSLVDFPVAADYDRVGHAELTVFRPATAQWFIQGYALPFGFGGANLYDVPVPADYDGVGYAQPAVFRPATAQWFIAGHAAPISFGAADLLDIPVPGDYDGDGRAELAVFRPATAQWFIAGHAAPISFGATDLLDIPLEAPIGSLLKLGLLQGPSTTIRSAAQGAVGAPFSTVTTGSASVEAVVAANLIVPDATGTSAKAVAASPGRHPRRKPRHQARRAALVLRAVW